MLTPHVRLARQEITIETAFLNSSVVVITRKFLFSIRSQISQRNFLKMFQKIILSSSLIKSLILSVGHLSVMQSKRSYNLSFSIFVNLITHGCLSILGLSLDFYYKGTKKPSDMQTKSTFSHILSTNGKAGAWGQGHHKHHTSRRAREGAPAPTPHKIQSR